jgi:predicted ABC-class ATPase
MATERELNRELLRIDGRGYPAYKDIKGSYDFRSFTLHVDHVQGDPYASPSRLRVTVPLSVAGFPEDLLNEESRLIGVCAHLAREFSRRASDKSSRMGSGKSGLLTMDGPGQEVFVTTAVTVHDDVVDARFYAGLPARGRRVMGRRAVDMLIRDLPKVVEASLFHRNLDAEEVRRSALANQDADAARALLAERGLVAFIANGSVLPRRSGVDQRPMGKEAVPVKSPASLESTLELPNAGEVTGMGIPRGVTLIVGGGFHGKSTVLEALERGVYNHCPGDGRQLAVTDPTAVKIRAEDARSVSGVDISPFISELPRGIDTKTFSTQNASGSTSQAANIMEALEAGAKVLLVDEDTSATNFMIRDSRMQELITKEKEPITPFVDKIRQLWEERGVSTVLVMGGSGDYFEVADTVIAMEEYVPVDVTGQAKEIVANKASERRHEGGESFGDVSDRRPQPHSLDPRKGKKQESVKSRGVKTVLFGTDEIDLSSVAQIVHPGQLRAIGDALLKLRRHADGERTLARLLDEIEEGIDREGLDFLTRRKVGNLSMFRRFELAAALNRIRTLRVEPGPST